MSDKLKNVWMYGGGVQSCAIASLIVQGKLAPPDIALIADTGREKQSTWDYLKDIIQPALSFKIHIIRKEDYNSPDIWKKETLLLPAYSDINGDPSKMPTFCSGEWKIMVCNRFLRDKGIMPRHRINWYGFSLDEETRIVRLENASRNKGKVFSFPLVDCVPMRRHDCINAVEKMGWPTPPRSSCWMCPNMRHDEWQDLKENYPEEFAKAVKLEVEVRQKDPHAFFHRSCKPLDQVDFEREPDLFNRPCDSGVCFV